VDLWAVSDSYRYGIFVPDEDPPGNQVTPRVQKFQLLSHSLQRFALMLTPRSIPGVVVSPRILRHAPSCYFLVTMRAADWRVRAASFDYFSGLGGIPVSTASPPSHLVDDWRRRVRFSFEKLLGEKQ
jgi:hypothetical protein